LRYMNWTWFGSYTLMKKKVIWYLFDSDKGAGKRAFNLWDKKDNYEFYSIGLSTCNTTHFKSVDLSKYKDSIKELDKLIKLGELKKPDIILASPPCEAWSLVKSPLQAFRFDKINNKFIWDNEASWTARRDYPDGTPRNRMMRFYKWDKIKKTQELGTACIETTKLIIDNYKPSIYLIENGASTYIWRYIKYVLNWDIIENKFDYGAYGWSCKKPTGFNGNIKLITKRETKEQERVRHTLIKSKWKYGNIKGVKINDDGKEIWHGVNVMTKMFASYAERSDIPNGLLIDIYNQIDSFITNREKYI